MSKNRLEKIKSNIEATLKATKTDKFVEYDLVNKRLECTIWNGFKTVHYIKVEYTLHDSYRVSVEKFEANKPDAMIVLNYFHGKEMLDGFDKFLYFLLKWE